MFQRLIILALLVGCAKEDARGPKSDGEVVVPPDSECTVVSHEMEEPAPGWLFDVPEDVDDLYDITIDATEEEWVKFEIYDQIYRNWQYGDKEGKKPKSPTICATMTIENVKTGTVVGTSEGIGLALKGKLDNSYRGPNDNPYLKIDLAHSVEGATLDGMSDFRLYNHGQDLSGIQRYLGYKIWRDDYNDGLNAYPAPRAGFATLNLNGQSLGIYGTNETIKEEFVRRWFDIGDIMINNLYEGEYGTDFMLSGCSGSDDDGPCFMNIEVEAGPGAADDAALEVAIEKIRPMVVEIDDHRTQQDGMCGALNRQIPGASNMDLDKFMTFFALETVIGAREGYSYLTNNYFMFDAPSEDGSEGNYVLIPWGFDQVLHDDKSPDFAGAVIPMGIIEDQECKARFDQELATVIAQIDWQAVYDDAVNTTAFFDAAETNSLGIHEPADVESMRSDILAFIKNRCETLSKVYLDEPESLCPAVSR